MSFFVELSPTAKADLERPFEFLIDRFETTEDLDRAQVVLAVRHQREEDYH